MISINMASVFALSGKKTILIGLDLRKPKIYDDFDLPNDHPLYDKFIKSQGTYKKICQWVIYIDDINTYNSAAYTYNTSSGPINRSFKFTIPYDNLIINYKGIDYNPQFYQSSTEKLLTINNTYFIRVLPNRTSLGSISENKSVDIYYTLNRPIITKAIEGSSYYRTGGDGIINWNNPTLETDKINGQKTISTTCKPNKSYEKYPVNTDPSEYYSTYKQAKTSILTNLPIDDGKLKYVIFAAMFVESNDGTRLKAYENNLIDIPVFSRLKGTESEKAKEMLQGSRTNIFDSVEEAINAAVMGVKK